MLDTTGIKFVPFSESGIVTSDDVLDSDIVVPEFLSWMMPFIQITGYRSISVKILDCLISIFLNPLTANFASRQSFHFLSTNGPSHIAFR